MFLNATIYVANITADTPFGTPVIYFSAVIGNQALRIVFLNFVANALVERVFKFANGRNDVTLTPEAGDGTITIENQIQYVDDPRMNTQPGSSPAMLPDTYEMSISVSAYNPITATTVEGSVRAFVRVDLPPGKN